MVRNNVQEFFQLLQNQYNAIYAYLITMHTQILTSQGVVGLSFLSLWLVTLLPFFKSKQSKNLFCVGLYALFVLLLKIRKRRENKRQKRPCYFNISVWAVLNISSTIRAKTQMRSFLVRTRRNEQYFDYYSRHYS